MFVSGSAPAALLETGRPPGSQRPHKDVSLSKSLSARLGFPGTGGSTTLVSGVDPGLEPRVLRDHLRMPGSGSCWVCGWQAGGAGRGLRDPCPRSEQRGLAPRCPSRHAVSVSNVHATALPGGMVPLRLHVRRALARRETAETDCAEAEALKRSRRSRWDSLRSFLWPRTRRRSHPPARHPGCLWAWKQAPWENTARPSPRQPAWSQSSLWVVTIPTPQPRPLLAEGPTYRGEERALRRRLPSHHLLN